MVWIALVTGLGSGLVGSVIGTMLTVSHQRAAEFRSRMLSAAEDFLAGARFSSTLLMSGPQTTLMRVAET